MTDDIRDEIDKYREEGKFITDVFRERQADDEFERLEQAELEKELREKGVNLGGSSYTKKRGRFF